MRFLTVGFWLEAEGSFLKDFGSFLVNRLKSMLVRYLTDDELDEGLMFELLQRATVVND